MAVVKGPKQAPAYTGPTTTPATAASLNKANNGPVSSPVPQMRPGGFDAIVASQLQAASDNGGPTPRVLGGPNQNVSNFSQAMGNFGQGVRGIFEAIQPYTPMGMAMGLVQNLSKGLNAARNGGGPDPKVQAVRQRELLANQAASGGDNPPVAPVPEAPAVDQNVMPEQRPPWWPAYLPWPPAGPNVPAPPGIPPVQDYGTLPPPNSYSTSYSGMQNAISNAQNPLMMGIGGMLRRP